MKLAVMVGVNDAFSTSMITALGESGWRVESCMISARDTSATTQDTIDAGTAMICVKRLDGPVDMLILHLPRRTTVCAATIREDMDDNVMQNEYEWQAVAPLRIIHMFLPLMEQSSIKRICVAASPGSSINACNEISDYANHMAGAARNMAVTELFNGLRPRGYTFRLYKKSEDPQQDCWAAEYFLQDRAVDLSCVRHSDEDRIVLRDYQGREIPW